MLSQSELLVTSKDAPEEVVSQLVDRLPITLLVCASMGSNPVTATLCP